MSRGLTPVLVLVALAGCRQVFGVGDTQVAVDADGKAPDAPAGVVDAASPDARFDAAPQTPDAPPTACPPAYTLAIGSHFYQVSTENRAWDEARDLCLASGAMPPRITYLAIPDDDIENQTLANALGGEQWIGISDLATETSFVTVLGAPPGYTKWNAFEPDSALGLGANEDCVRIRSTGEWYDESCANNRPFVCECQ